MVRFLAEIAQRRYIDAHTTPYNFAKGIYKLNISDAPTESYWLDWGGVYDQYIGKTIEMYYRQFLRHVESMQDLENNTVQYAIFIDTTTFFVYIKVPIHTWLYPDYGVSTEELIPYLSAALNPNKPYNNNLRGINAKVLLQVPNINIRLSEGMSGIRLNQGFSLSLINNDGFFDNDKKFELFNTPIYIKKSMKENPEYDDFKPVREGFVSTTNTGFDTFSIDAVDRLSAMSMPVCDVLGEFYNGIAVNENARGKNIPVVYGQAKVKLIKLNNNCFLAAEHISYIIAVLDKDGNEIIDYNFNNNIITHADADSAVIVGYHNYRIGQIIRDLVVIKGGISFIGSYWNIEEVQNYIINSPPVYITFNSGDIKKSVQELLKSDMAYFMQQMDGKFTIRRWGNKYKNHEIESWRISGTPQKQFDNASDNYFSSCKISYEDGYNNKLYYIYDELRKYAEDKYRKIKEAEFETNLANINDVIALAKLLGDRYVTIRQNITVPVGVETLGMEMLDTVTLTMQINNREFTKKKQFVLTGINPAQDILTLEEIDGDSDA